MALAWRADAQPGSPAPTASPTTASQLPAQLEGVGIDQNLGAELPLDATFRDETGAEVTLGQYFGEKPVMMALVYYECPMLCGLVLSGIASTLKPLDFVPGKEFDVVVVSIDPKETPELAATTKASTIERYGHPETADGWHFLTGDEDQIRRLADAVGFHYRYDPATDLFIHAGGIFLATADGHTSRYFYGVEYPPRDVRLGLVEASDNQIGSAVDQVLLFCFRYDPTTGKYSAAVLNLMRAIAVLTLSVLAILIVRMVIRERRSNAKSNVGTA
ncbi:MAG: SCO family protein [Acidobacteria bacterium]|nr:SCO family protein [Acidobacteriota bacterium]